MIILLKLLLITMISWHILLKIIIKTLFRAYHPDNFLGLNVYTLRWLIALFLTSRDLRVSKVSLEPTERKELGYVKWISRFYEVHQHCCYGDELLSQLYIKPKGSSMLIIFFKDEKTISFLISSSFLNHSRYYLSNCGTLAAFHFSCLSDGTLASLQKKWLFVATEAKKLGFSLFHTLMWPT